MNDYRGDSENYKSTIEPEERGPIFWETPPAREDGVTAPKQSNGHLIKHNSENSA